MQYIDNGHLNRILQAEEQVKLLLQTAQKEKDIKQKDAQQQAQEEIQQYRAKKEQEFIQFKAQHESKLKTQDDRESKLNEEIDHINQQFSKNQQSVAKYLVDQILDIEIKVPQVMKSNFEDYFKK